ncbi:MAG: hypothetical protein FVQ77_16915 [Cytophagales bacterium]|nr:hypothetical protein [Cytophagales bacterium]
MFSHKNTKTVGSWQLTVGNICNQMIAYCLLSIVNCQFFLIIFLVSCEIINPPEEIPSYIRISNIDFDPEYSGSSSHKIVDAWLEVDNEIIGTFELPATIPVLKQGTKKVIIYAGVYRDGIKGLRIRYPFYTIYDTMRTLVAGTIDTINPVVNYDSTIIFPFNEEDFEQGNLFSKNSGNIDIIRESNLDSLDFPEGKDFIGFIDVPEGLAENIDIATTGDYILPKKPVYLEINFKSNMNLTVGLYARHPVSQQVVSIEKLVLFPANSWKKIYISLIDEVASQPDGATFNVFFKASSLGDKDYYIALDNIKLLHF